MHLFTSHTVVVVWPYFSVGHGFLHVPNIASSSVKGEAPVRTRCVGNTAFDGIVVRGERIQNGSQIESQSYCRMFTGELAVWLARNCERKTKDKYKKCYPTLEKYKFTCTQVTGTIYTCMHACIYTHIHLHICTHTHAYTHPSLHPFIHQ